MAAFVPTTAAAAACAWTPAATAVCAKRAATAPASAAIRRPGRRDVAVLVDMYAEWCGPCKLVAPLMDLIAMNLAGKLKVVKIDTEQYPSFVKKYKVHGLPTFMVVKNGEVLNIQEGAMRKAKLYENVHTHLPELK
ncbi:hypothetical protein I4F81_009949 [Pyropia yezoensis]|uniref:Uncharacterized protein n=1 Tax=Pyropia yezoensis TaxID=2788 RepID=A0ACC3CB95_PYRYE|nr:hypothetical protein I4F81_009949 [Neopyropia yezoensis]